MFGLIPSAILSASARLALADAGSTKVSFFFFLFLSLFASDLEKKEALSRYALIVAALKTIVS